MLRRIVTAPIRRGFSAAADMSLLLQLLVVRPRRTVYPAPDTLIIHPTTDAEVVRQPNGDLRVRWRVEAESVRLYTGTRPDAVDWHGPLAEVSGGEVHVLSGLDPAVRHYIALDFTGGPLDGRRLIAAERILPLHNGVNFRDIGGYRTRDGRYVRWGRVYRSGDLSTLTDADLAYLAGIGLRLVCDLRTPHEAKAHPDRLPLQAGVEYLHLPVFSVDESSFGPREFLRNLRRLDALMVRSYTEFLVAEKALIFGEALRRLADPHNLPAVVHCTAGKDRTGITLALLLAILGVPDDLIVADYSLSNQYYDHILATQKAAAERLARLRLTLNDLMPLFSADPKTLEVTLAFIRERYGSVEGYLRGEAGLDDAVFESLRANLLD